MINTAYNSTLNQFAKTRGLFREYLNFTENYTFDAWSQLDDDRAAAALFVQFYDQITFAWYKAKSFYGDEDEAVECALQYLQKNVSIIRSNEKRFTSSYIYRVTYNCLYCICHDRKIDKDRYENEVSNIVTTSVNDADSSVDLFDLAPSTFDVDRDMEIANMWADIAALGDKALKVAEKLINGEKIKACYASTVEQLQIVLLPYKDLLVSSN